LTASPKSDCEALLESAATFAEQLLAKYGEFYPFGYAMKNSGEIVSIAAYEGNERPPSADLVEMLKHAFRERARTGEYRATALTYDVRIASPDAAETSDAIAVALDHHDNYSVVVVMPYRLDEGEPVLGEAFAQRGAADIFQQH